MVASSVAEVLVVLSFATMAIINKTLRNSYGRAFLTVVRTEWWLEL
jgi:hypothetical protein